MKKLISITGVVFAFVLSAFAASPTYQNFNTNQFNNNGNQIWIEDGAKTTNQNLLNSTNTGVTTVVNRDGGTNGSFSVTNYIVAVFLNDNTNTYVVTNLGTAAANGTYVISSRTGDISHYTNTTSSTHHLITDFSFGLQNTALDPAAALITNSAGVKLYWVDVNFFDTWNHIVLDVDQGAAPAGAADFPGVYSTNSSPRFGILNSIPMFSTAEQVLDVDPVVGSDLFGQPGPTTPYRTLHGAVADAGDSNVIYLRPGFHTLTNSLQIPMRVKVKGAGRGSSIINITNSSHRFSLGSYNLLENLNVNGKLWIQGTNGSLGSPGGVDVTVANCDLGNTSLETAVANAAGIANNTRFLECQIIAGKTGLELEDPQSTLAILPVYLRNCNITVTATNGTPLAVGLGHEQLSGGYIRMEGGSIKVSGATTNVCISVAVTNCFVTIGNVLLDYPTNANSFAVAYWAGANTNTVTFYNQGVNTNRVRNGFVNLLP